jgi:hypothetical protein
MAKYIVEEMAEVWYRVEVEAEDEDTALEVGMNKLMNGEGSEIPFTFEWQEEYSIREDN